MSPKLDLTPEEAIPQHILRTLFRSLVWCGGQITQEQREEAWRYLEDRNPWEEMGQ